MLDTIKSMINQKASFMEAANVIFEDVSGKNLDDQIILGEKEDIPADEVAGGEPEVPNETNTEEGEHSDSEGPESTDNQDVNKPENQEPDTTPGSADTGDILNSEVDELGVGVPNPVGAQTGEPINPNNDILNVEIDLASNTVKDVLPVPPASASEVVPTNDNEPATQHVDSGFSGEGNNPGQGNDVPPASTDNQQEEVPGGNPSYVENYFGSLGLGTSKPYQEAITLGDAVDDEEKKDDKDEKPSSEPTADEEPQSSETEESPVTSAVKEKIADTETDVNLNGGSEEKIDILKKLGAITKNIEDVKKNIMNSIQ